MFSLVFAGFRKGLSAENLLFRWEGMTHSSRINYLTYNLPYPEINKTIFNIICLIFKGAGFFQTPGVFIDSPGRRMGVLKFQRIPFPSAARPAPVVFHHCIFCEGSIYIVLRRRKQQNDMNFCATEAYELNITHANKCA